MYVRITYALCVSIYVCTYVLHCLHKYMCNLYSKSCSEYVVDNLYCLRIIYVHTYVRMYVRTYLHTYNCIQAKVKNKGYSVHTQIMHTAQVTRGAPLLRTN